MSLETFIAAMPKAELHLHLEGSVRPATLLELARRNGVALPADDETGLRALYRFTSFERFIEVYFLIKSVLRSPEDYALIVRDLGAEMDRQNIRYAEVTWTPQLAEMQGLSYEEALAGVEAGREEARRLWGVEMRWLPDIARDYGPEAGEKVAAQAIAGLGRGVIGLGLGGSEHRFPPELFEAAFARTRAAGLRSYPHAGELAGPESVWSALRLLGADRIGHGVRAIEDPELVAYLRDRQITLDVCPTSNICLHLYPDYAAHPLHRLYDAGVPVTINTDDPPLFNTDLVSEYRVAAHHFGFGADDLCRLSLNAVRGSFLPEADRACLAGEFEAEFERLKRRHL